MMGRIFGWALLTVALVWAAGEGLLIIDSQQTTGLTSGEVWTLLTGSSLPSFNNALWMAAADRVYGLPAWVALAIGAILLLALSRKRQPKRKLLFGTMRSSALH
jgi:hypothetical protein